MGYKTPRTYTIPVGSYDVSPLDNTTYYFGCTHSKVPNTTATAFKVRVPMSGVIRAAFINSFAATVAGSNESQTMYIRIDNSTDVTIAAVSTTDAEREFVNYSLNTHVSAGSYLTIKWVCPSFATNPTNVKNGGYILIEAD